MKVLQIVQENLGAMGFFPNVQQNNRCQFNRKQKISTFQFFYAIAAIALFVIYEARTIEEYMHSILTLIIILGITASYISIIFKNDQIFFGIDFCEKQLNGSK